MCRGLPSMPSGWTLPQGFRSPDAESLLELCREALEARGLAATGCLLRDCQNAPECWTGVAPPREPLRPRLPWVGPQYAETRVLVIGMNALTHAGWLDEAY